MYESFYGLKEKPFTLLPDPDYLYLSPKHQRALTLLEYGMMNQAGFSVICGDTGAGKTTLIRRLLVDLGDDTRVGLITNTHPSFGELLNWVLMAFGLDGEDKSKAQMHHMFIEFLIEQYAQNKHTVLIVDEAQNMSADTLEELRMLSNINADKDQVLQVILAGQPALRDTLRKPELMQFAQRIAVDYYLEALSDEETRAYIHHRLKVAGSTDIIFTDAACHAIYKYSSGTPRLINLLCDTSLVYGFAEQNKLINEQLVHDVVREQHSNSIIPTFNTSQPHSSDRPAQAEAQQLVVDETIVEEKPLEKKQDVAVDELTEKAVNTLNSAEQMAVVAHAQSTSSISQVKMESRGSASVISDEVTEEPKDDSNITPIHARMTEKEPLIPEADVQENKAPNRDADTDSLDTHSTQSDSSPVDPTQPEDDEMIVKKTHHRYPDEDDAYPIVHIEDNPRKGISMVFVALMSGMFFASVILVGVAWMLFTSSENNLPLVMPLSGGQQQLRQSDRRQLESLQKERDAALAITRALERERDAAILSAKAQQEMRAAELRSAEILAAQELRAEKKLQQARARTRQAERAELKARERERALKLQSEQREAELEARQIEMLQKERQRLQALAAKAAEDRRLLEAEQALEVRKTTVIIEKPQIRTEKEKKAKRKESFSANPCNSPSAKFLSTCKK